MGGKKNNVVGDQLVCKNRRGLRDGAKMEEKIAESRMTAL